MEKFNERFDAIIIEVLKLNPGKVDLKNLSACGCSSWDSLAQMILVQKLEEEFCVTLSLEEILEFKSYLIGFDIVKNKI